MCKPHSTLQCIAPLIMVEDLFLYYSMDIISSRKTLIHIVYFEGFMALKFVFYWLVLLISNIASHTLACLVVPCTNECKLWEWRWLSIYFEFDWVMFRVPCIRVCVLYACQCVETCINSKNFSSLACSLVSCLFVCT